VVTVALDLRGLEKAGRYLRRANPTHPALIDRGHRLDELLGIVNVPSGVWVDEEGMIVRPPETAFPEGSINALPADALPPVPDELDPYLKTVLEESRKIRVDAATYIAALRDWAAHGRQSRHALTPEEVVERSRPRPPEVSLAAAHFELGQHLFQQGKGDDAVPHFREAHRLQPDNWTYKREAWSIARRDQGPTDLYEGDWVKDVRRIGAENYYPPLEM
jgi:tetratricopeptide (TPR) repeat protein